MTAGNGAPAPAGRPGGGRGTSGRILALAAAWGIAGAAIVGLDLLVVGYPPPVDAAEWIAVAVNGTGLAVASGLAVLCWLGHRLWLAALVPAAVLLAATIAELAEPRTRVVIHGERLTIGDPWLGAVAASWPVLLLATTLTALYQARLARRPLPPLYGSGAAPPPERPRWRRALVLAAAGGAAAGVLVPLALPLARVPAAVVVWGAVGYAAAFAIAVLLAVRPALAAPSAVLLGAALLASMDARALTLGEPATVFLALWPAYLALALLTALAEWAVRAIVRAVRRRRPPAPPTETGDREHVV
ncbi:hypothetical protein [Allonocardiopsis opalescens]|uniref:Uncharacterized protein n=1 Tax=Allonocardiopsis opalescens TaxID=1144618 RepID=A0A2T0Q0I5_9ACTN|nr:hypothetical protein [Allonocardiopsis opalescens]PRX97312.1 hypothetical protein CLV72_106349 [Allonocardiopsis opalescens]